MRDLYSANTPASLWRSLLVPEPSLAEWDQFAEVAVDLLPAAAREQSTECIALANATLGEGQFGDSHWQLNSGQRLYYRLKPFIPRRIIETLRRWYQASASNGYALHWPVENRYVDVQWQILQGIARQRGLEQVPMIRFWPDDSDFAYVITHDVETAKGQAFVRELAAIDERFGVRSSFNFVVRRYPVDCELLAELSERGFEVGVHGWKHDGRLFSSRAEFERRAQGINEALVQWNAVGFRAPLTHRHPEWLQTLNIEYDLSFFDTDPFETIPGGTMSIWPFFLGHFVELPYTLVQDHTLMVVLKEQTPRLWLEKVDYIKRNGGMALVNAHPDYLHSAKHRAIYTEFLEEMQRIGGFWQALPRDVARWWRARAEATAVWQDGCWQVPGLPGAVVGTVDFTGEQAEIVRC